MILVKNRVLLFSDKEQYIGTPYDNFSTVRTFRIDRVSPDGVDLSHLTFQINMERVSGTEDTDSLDKQVSDEHILLTWTIKEGMIGAPGTAFVSLRGHDLAGTVKWGTFKAPVYIGDMVSLPELDDSQLSMIETMESKIELIYVTEVLREEAENERAQAENERVAEANSVMQNVKDATNAANSAAENANNAAAQLDELGNVIDSAVAAANNANAAAENANTVAAGLEGEITELKADLTKYLPKDGSVPMSGSLTVSKASNPAVNVENTGNARTAYLQEMNNKNMALVNYNEDNGDSAQIIIPSEDTSLSEAVLYYRKVNGTENVYKVYGEHNKPSGTYSGNGDATERKINTGGIGKLLYVVYPKHGHNMLVTRDGAFCWTHNGTTKVLTNGHIHFRDGVLVITSSDEFANEAGGSTYTYQVL